MLEPITAKEYAKLLGVGIDVDWLSFKRINYYYFYWRAKGVNVPAYFKRRGFSNVRIRVSGDVVSNKTVLKELSDVVEDCLHAGIIPIIAYSADGFRNDPTNTTLQEHFIKWWVTVAEHFRNTSYLLSYNLIIETSGPIAKYPSILNKVYNETIAAIRKIDKYRIIIVTPPRTSSPFELSELKVRWDPYMMAEWHIYAGGPKEHKHGNGKPYNETLINEAVNAATTWSEEHGIPTWVGAWRPNRYLKHGNQHYPDGAPKGIYPMNVAIEFSKVMVNALKKHGIPYDINADALFFDIAELKWYPSQKHLLDVILGLSDP